MESREGDNIDRNRQSFSVGVTLMLKQLRSAYSCEKGQPLERNRH